MNNINSFCETKPIRDERLARRSSFGVRRLIGPFPISDDDVIGGKTWFDGIINDEVQCLGVREIVEDGNLLLLNREWAFRRLSRRRVTQR